MRTQTHRRWNLARLLSDMELAGHETAQSQADLLGRIVTPRKLVRMMFQAPISTDMARALEHAFRKPRGWMDQRHATDDPLDATTPERPADMGSQSTG
ncbi:hypothetical protein P3W24_00880 [Luteibacter sp. PPL201]|uniref:Uncharacterized protein n=1 Tax=Luteibacter sahnii TaxID=3021977 RepID=A0ABT6B5Z2_9GAMM|nr:hypothetical protein [Luteibacter sp. PPL193]MDY1548530.1 hypothetical protein [Luteibacter sp. PPL193]